MLMKKFLAGMLMGAFLMPLAEGITSVCNQFCEYLCILIARKSYYIHKEIEDEEAENEEPTHVVGFQIPNTIEEDEEDD